VLAGVNAVNYKYNRCQPLVVSCSRQVSTSTKHHIKGTKNNGPFRTIYLHNFDDDENIFNVTTCTSLLLLSHCLLGDTKDIHSADETCTNYHTGSLEEKEEEAQRGLIKLTMKTAVVTLFVFVFMTHIWH